MQPLFLQPVFKERIWGGTALHTEFEYVLPNDNTGECWAISAHPNGPSVVGNGPYAGLSLDMLWREQPDLFGNPEEAVFPLLTKYWMQIWIYLFRFIQMIPMPRFMKMGAW